MVLLHAKTKFVTVKIEPFSESFSDFSGYTLVREGKQCHLRQALPSGLQVPVRP